MICGLLFQTLRNIEERITGDFVLDNIWSGKQTEERVSVSGNFVLFLGQNNLLISLPFVVIMDLANGL
jgi:hypothetical protein